MTVDFWGWAQQLWASHGPGSPFEVLLVGMIGLLTYLVKNIVTSQRDINRTLNNHFTEAHTAFEEVNRHMARSNQILQTILDRVLDSALRPPQIGEKDS